MGNEQAEYWSAVAQRYDRVVDLQIGSNARALVLARAAQEGRLGRLVEVGCGSGLFTQVLADKADSLVATDLAPGMLALARQRVTAAHVTFQLEDCERTSLPDASFDAAFVSLVLHFTEPVATLAEMHRLLKPGGTLLIVNLDPLALTGLDRVRCLIRVVYQGVAGYRAKPPKGFGKNLLTEQHLRRLLAEAGFDVVAVETIRDPARSSSIPLEYVRARRV